MKIYIKRAVSVICVAALFLACGEFFRYILVDDTTSYTRLMMHQLHDTEENIDVLFVGSSHMYRSVNPEIADKWFCAHTFNAGSSSQEMDGSLAVIQEAISCHQISQIYLEMYFWQVTSSPYAKRTSLTSTYIIADYMKPSLRKIQYLLHASSAEHYANSFIIARRDWTQIFDADYVKDLLLKKSADSYQNYEWSWAEGALEYYVDRGFVANDKVVKEGTYWNSAAYSAINKNALAGDYLDSLEKIVAICEKNNIQLTLFAAPMPEWTIVGKGDYDSYVQTIRAFAQENGLRFYDFNLCKAEYFDANNRTFFKDTDHLNTNGAEAFSELFSAFFTGHIAEDELFFDSLSAKLMNEPPVVYGAAGPVENSSEGVKVARIISSRTDDLEYRIIITPKDGIPYVVQDFSTNKKFSYPIGETGTVTISSRTLDCPSKVWTIEFAYS